MKLKKCRGCGEMMENYLSYCPECGTYNAPQLNKNPYAAENSTPPDTSQNKSEDELNQYNNNNVRSSYYQSPQMPQPQQLPQYPAGYQQPYAPIEEDKASLGLCLLSFLIPLFGWIYCGVKYSKTPKRAKACAIVATISFGFNLFLTVLSSIISSLP